MELQLYAGGRKDHLAILKKKLKQQIQLIKNNLLISAVEKKAKIKALEANYQKEKKETKKNLY